MARTIQCVVSLLLIHAGIIMKCARVRETNITNASGGGGLECCVYSKNHSMLLNTNFYSVSFRCAELALIKALKA